MPTIDEVWRQINALPHRYIFYTRKEIRYLPEILGKGEKILALTSGYMQSSTWLCVCTDRRVLFLNRGMFFGQRQVQMNLDRIQAIDSSHLIFFGGMRFWDGASSIAVSMILKSSIAPFVRTTQEAMDHYKRQMVYDLAQSAHQTATATGSLNPKPDFVAELERLGKLRAEGHLSEAEFEQAKTKLLKS
jgi:hypothetical protein